MSKQVKIFITGLLLVLPAGVTVYLIVWLGGLIGQAGARVASSVGLNLDNQVALALIGAAGIAAAIYLVGLLSRVVLFRALGQRLEALLVRLPGVKIVYESVRDIMRLFGGEAKAMGRAVVLPERGGTGHARDFDQ